MYSTCKRSVRAFLVASTLAGLLSACGGGGGSSPPEPPKPTLTFTPAKVVAAFDSGTSASVPVTATVNKLSDFNGAGTVYAYIEDTTGVILPRVEISLNGSSLSAVLHTSPTLAFGAYEGELTVKVCRDSACAQQFPGSPMKLPYKFDVTPAPLKVTYNAPFNITLNSGYAAPPPAPLYITKANQAWNVSASASWIKLSTTGGTGNGSVLVSYDIKDLTPAPYAATINVTSNDGQSVAVPVSMLLLPRAFAVESGKIMINAINGAPITPRAINFTMPGASSTWTASAEQPWMSVTPAAGSTPGSTTISVDPGVGKLASGTHLNSLLLNAPMASTTKVPVEMVLNKATFATSANAVTLGGAAGRDMLPQGIKLSLNTGTNAHPWTLTGLPAWASASATAGTANHTGTSVVFTPTTGTTVGTTVAALTATATVNGDTLTMPLNLTINRDQRKLLFSQAGVALTSTPSLSRLTSTVSVKENYGAATTWTVSTDQSWLTMTRQGSQLTLTADPTALSADTINYAKVTLSTSDVGVTTPESLQVALWKGSVTPSGKTKLSKTYQHVKADPIRPLAYANNRGTSIDVYNVYTGALVTTIQNLGAALADMSVSPNGDLLFTYDTANRALVVVDLKTMSKAGTWPLTAAVNGNSRLLVIRPNGVNIVLAADGAAYLASSGKQIATTGITAPQSATTDGTRVYASSQLFRVDYTDVGGGTFLNLRGPGVSGTDVAVSGDGTRLYTATGSPYHCVSYSPTDNSVIGALPGGSNYPNNVEVGSDGRVFCGISGWYSTADVWVHSANGVLLSSFKFAGYAEELLSGQLSISGDGLVIVALTSDPALVFVPIGL
jgi:hypothetical protein